MTDYTLAVDTSAGTSVALLHNGSLVAEVNIDNNMKHAELIGQAIADVLSEAKIQPNQITKVVIGRGPAPFTGLRVGIAAAVMFAEGASAATFGVVSLDGIAFAASADNNLDETKTLLVTSDARRGELYWALYKGKTRSGVPIRIDGPRVSKPDALEAELEDRGYNQDTLKRTDAKLTAANLARVVEGHLLDGLSDTDLTPLYLREPDAVAPKRNPLFGGAR